MTRSPPVKDKTLNASHLRDVFKRARARRVLSDRSCTRATSCKIEKAPPRMERRPFDNVVCVRASSFVHVKRRSTLLHRRSETGAVRRIREPCAEGARSPCASRRASGRNGLVERSWHLLTTPYALDTFDSVP